MVILAQYSLAIFLRTMDDEKIRLARIAKEKIIKISNYETYEVEF